MTRDALKEYGKVIAKNLRRIMLKANKSQADLFRELGIGKTTIRLHSVSTAQKKTPSRYWERVSS